MNGRTAKKIRGLFLLETGNPNERKLYRKAKKIYSRVPNKDKAAFLEHLENVRNTHLQRMAIEKSLG